MDTILDSHHCSENEEPETDSIQLVDYEDAPFPHWFLITKDYADERDVRMGEADEVGEIVAECWHAINFCPFCGEKLATARKTK